MSEIHDLDEGVGEYFEFVMFKKKYRFKHLTTRQLKQMTDLKGDNEDFFKFLSPFIEPVNPEDPPFADVYPNITLPMTRKFSAMIQKEFMG